jgi:hypothetical protein
MLPPLLLLFISHRMQKLVFSNTTIEVFFVFRCGRKSPIRKIIGYKNIRVEHFCSKFLETRSSPFLPHCFKCFLRNAHFSSKLISSQKIHCFKHSPLHKSVIILHHPRGRFKSIKMPNFRPKFWSKNFNPGFNS